jgi:hypothetical protein
MKNILHTLFLACLSAAVVSIGLALIVITIVHSSIIPNFEEILMTILINFAIIFGFVKYWQWLSEKL